MTDEVNWREDGVETPRATTSIQIGDNSIASTDATVPTDRMFRNAWVLGGTVITEDVDAARAIFKDKVRETRKPLLEAEDVVYMKALETDDTDAKAASVTKKTALRDATSASAISSATTIDELKAAWPTDLLGASPYS